MRDMGGIMAKKSVRNEMYSQIITSGCLLCGEQTSSVFKIESGSKQICLKCANAITRQNVEYLVNGDMRR